MSNELALIQQRYAEIPKTKEAKLPNPYFSKLRVNVVKGVGKTPTTGRLVLGLQDGSVVFFDKPVNVILTTIQTQFRRGFKGKDKFENVSKSVILPQFSKGPYISTDGGIKCSQIPTTYETATKTKLHQGTTTPLSAEELALNGQVSYTLYPFGVLDISQGTLEDGTTPEVGTFVPCLLHVSKGILNSVQNGFKEVYKEYDRVLDAILTVGVGKLHKVGTTEFFEYTLTNGGAAPQIAAVADAYFGIKEYITQENDYIIKAHAKASQGEVVESTDYDIDGEAVEETEE